jgi:hypothetical protein
MLMTKPKLTKSHEGRSYMWTYPRFLSRLEAINMQETEGGCAQAGYGFFGWSYDSAKGVTTWFCADSCD